jgi:oxygen-independent coproporphyrinogen-3 oxidase
MRLELPLRSFRDHLVGEKGRFALEPQRTVVLRPVRRADLYIHVPFCKSLCPYCPYNRVLFEHRQATAYMDAMLLEIDLYRQRLGPIEIGSVYVGGGTPTSVADQLGRLFEHIDRRFTRRGPIAIETIPSDLDKVTLQSLRDIGVNMLSIGVQSFDDRYLKLIGRPYRSAILAPVIDDALSSGFDSVNVDMMFALPKQTKDEVLADLDRAIDLGSDQVTLYPLFTFPYTSVGRHRSLHRVGFPSLSLRRHMYRAIHDDACARGLRRVSVWGFKRDAIERFSSVTRDDYIGIGAGSATRLPGQLHFNTFSVPDYIGACNASSLPVALVMPLTAMMEAWYWLYWRFYDTEVPKAALRDYFGDDPTVRRLFKAAAALQLLTDIGDSYLLTERGAFWIHLLQNYYILNYINTVWTNAMRTPWPGRIEL